MLDASEKTPTTNYDKQHIKCSSRTAYPISKLKCLIIRYILALQKKCWISKTIHLSQLPVPDSAPPLHIAPGNTDRLSTSVYAAV